MTNPLVFRGHRMEHPVIAHRVAARHLQAVGSATPAFDDLVKMDKRPKLEQKTKQAERILEQIERLDPLTRAETVVPLFKKMLDPAYEFFNVFRDFLRSGKDEIEVVQGKAFSEVVKEGESLLALLRRLDEAYRGIGGLKAEDYDREQAMNAANDLVIQMASIKTVYGQLLRAYDHLHTHS